MLSRDVPLSRPCLASYSYHSGDGKCQGITVRVRYDWKKVESRVCSINFRYVVYFVDNLSEEKVLHSSNIQCERCDSCSKIVWALETVITINGLSISKCFSIRRRFHMFLLGYLGVIPAPEGNPPIGAGQIPQS